MIKRLFLALLALVALLVLAVAINTWRQGSRQIDVPPLAPIAVDEKGAAESLSAANSRIKDVDVAEETSRMSRSQILLQAGTAALSQANQLPQAVLQLLR